MKRKVFIMSVALLIFAALSVNAQRGCENQSRKFSESGRSGNRNPEMKAYLESNVLPVMKIQRQELDTQIDAADKARLEEIRAELKSMRTIRIEKRNALRGSDEKPTLEQRKEMREHRDEMHKLMNEVGVMSEKYDVVITDALEDIHENAETWKQEMCDFRPGQKTGRGDCPPDRRNDMRNGKRQGKGSRQGFSNDRERGMPLQRFLSPEGFLLWNPDEPMLFFGENEGSENNLKVNLFPNPANKSVQVSVTLVQDEVIALELMDKDGIVVRSEKGINATEGIYTQTFDLSDLKNGIYFVKIKIGSETLVRQLIVQK